MFFYDRLKKVINFESLKSIWAVLIGAGVGVYIGVEKKEYVSLVAPMGEIYLDILEMCVLPILLSAITVSISRLMVDHGGSDYIKKILIVFLIFITFASVLGTTSGFITRPGSNLDTNALTTLGSVVQSSGKPNLEMSLSTPYIEPEKESIIVGFVFDLVPNNIFDALSRGDNLKVLFFAILFGTGIGALKKQSSLALISVMDSVSGTFIKIVQWLMYLLPFAFCGLISSTLSKIGVEALVGLIKFVCVVIGSYIFLSLGSGIIVWRRTGSLDLSVKALREPALLALVTSSIMAALPATITAMNKTLGYNKRSVDLIIPLSFTLCRIGPTMYFALATMFVAQLYDVKLDLESIFVVIVGSVIAGTATAGSSGVTLLAMLGLILSALKLPLEAVIILFIVIDPIIAPFRVLVSVHAACAIATLVLPKKELSLNNT
ncbi:dicarboxylate/amino acid:cation symporter [Agarilytica rhodophyticola]|uniref:dicarboxylate/amino acid:cation symporter n=1 Tax=Agarilytica rhodophyticola TaxID=1737490 RepID=UPI000B347ED5|nr:cation:dicarboxylase symporter family transporter [Agarilytica rhodophyticola]